MRWGIRDTTTKPKVTWIGNESGPILVSENDYETPEIAHGIARVMCQTLEMQVFGSDLGGKYQVEVFPETKPRRVESVPTKMDSLTALKRVEGDYN